MTAAADEGFPSPRAGFPVYPARRRRHTLDLTGRRHLLATSTDRTAVSNSRIFWIAWCTMWALGWLLIGFFTFFLGWIMVPVSLLAILIPVGGTGNRAAPQVAYPPPGWVPPGQQLPPGPPVPPNGPGAAPWWGQER